MSYMMEESRFLGGALVGVAGSAAVWQFGPAIAASSWTSAACAVGLLGASAAVAAGRWLTRGIDPVLLDMAEAPGRNANGFEWRQAERPRDWLRAKGVEAVPDEQVAGFLRGPLSADLTPLPLEGPGPFDHDPSDAVSSLAMALAARSLDKALRTAGTRLVLALDRAHGEPDRAKRDLLLAQAIGEARRLFADPEVKRVIRQTLTRHGMRETCLMGLLREARRKASIGPSEFSWLKGTDRGLWYALDNLGRRTFHVEGLAAMDHFSHEVAARGRLTVPHVDLAAAALARIAVGMRAKAGVADRPDAKPGNEDPGKALDPFATDLGGTAAGPA